MRKTWVYIAAVFAALAWLFWPKDGGYGLAQEQAEKAHNSQKIAIDAKKKQKEAEADAQLQEKRRLPLPDRVRGALDRYRSRVQQGSG